MPGGTPGLPMSLLENATTVRVDGSKTLTTDGPFVGVKQAVGGWLILEADDLDAAIEVAARVHAPRCSGAVEIRPAEVHWQRRSDVPSAGGRSRAGSACSSSAIVQGSRPHVVVQPVDQVDLYAGSKLE
jgi:hypothetical protein